MSFRWKSMTVLVSRLLQPRAYIRGARQLCQRIRLQNDLCATVSTISGLCSIERLLTSWNVATNNLDQLAVRKRSQSNRFLRKWRLVWLLEIGWPTDLRSAVYILRYRWLQSTWWWVCMTISWQMEKNGQRQSLVAWWLYHLWTGSNTKLQ